MRELAVQPLMRALAIGGALLLPWATFSTRPVAAGADGGWSAPKDGKARRDSEGKAALADDDREVIENLELLEHLDESRDLDLLLELSKEEAAPAK